MAFSSAGILQLDYREGQTVHEDDDVRPASVLALDDSELIDREPVVVLRGVEVDDARLRPGDRAIRSAVLHRDAVDEHPMEGVVPIDERRGVGPGQLPVRVVEGFGRHRGVEARERLAQTPFQDDIAVSGVGALRGWLADSNVRAVQNCVAELAEPRERSFLDDGFGKAAIHAASRSSLGGHGPRLQHRRWQYPSQLVYSEPGPPLVKAIHHLV